MERLPVQSSNVKSIGYEPAILEVEFQNGGVYRYFGVSQEHCDALMSATSKGGFIHDVIKPTYRVEKVHVPDTQGRIATLEVREGVVGAVFFGAEFDADPPMDGKCRTGYWRPLTEEEQLLVFALRRDASQAVST